MKCATWKELVSARIDGELDANEGANLDAHLAGCADCRAFAEVAHGLRRELLSVAETPPDVSAVVLARVAAEPVARWHRARVALGIVAAGELLLALQSTFGMSGHGHELHRHNGFMYLALAAGFAVAALRPARNAAGVATVTGVLFVCLVISSMLDLSQQRVPLFALFVHAVCISGVALAWWLTRFVAPPAMRVAVR